MNEEIRFLLLSWDEYNNKEFEVPYIYSIRTENQVLMYFGANHTNLSSHSQYERLDRVWQEFLDHSSEKKVAIGEGKNPRPIKASKEEAITEYGEQGYLRFLAKNAGIEVRYPDPAEPIIWNDLLSKYSKDELFLHDMMQFAHQWKRDNKQIPFEQYIESYLQYYRTNTNWNGYDFSFSYVKEISPGLIGEEFNVHSQELFYQLTNPSIFKTRFNELGRDIDVYRDTAAVKGILDLWREGFSIFVVFGSGHAVIQERALRQLAI